MNISALFADLPGSFWMPPEGSTFAGNVDDTFDLIVWINVLYGVPIFVLLWYFVAKYRRKSAALPEPSPHHSFLLEVTWTVIPTMMIVGLFFMGFVNYINMTTMPANPYEIQVGAKKWAWNFTYPNGFQSNELHVPAGRPVLLTMRSEDVMHSLFIPAFRVKMDCIPGRYTQLWFEALEPTVNPEDPTPAVEQTSEYDLFCTEYCGTQHSGMLAKVFVHNAGYFETWLEKAGQRRKYMPDCQAGEELWLAKGCNQCHSVDGKSGTGPTWQGIYGTEQIMTSGETVTVDANYIRESILNPNAKVRKGYRGIMPSYQGQLTEDDLIDIIAYHKSLNPDADGWVECVKMTDEEIEEAKARAEAEEAAAAE